MPPAPRPPLRGRRGVRVGAAVPGGHQQGGVEFAGQGSGAEERLSSLASLQAPVKTVDQGPTEQAEAEGGKNPKTYIFSLQMKIFFGSA